MSKKGIKLGELYTEESISLNTTNAVIVECGDFGVKGRSFRVYQFDYDWYYTFMYMGKNSWKCVYLIM